MKKSLFQTIVWSGLIVGTADISLACTNAYLRAGLSPANLLRYVASGFYGQAATEGGTGMIAMGLLFHFIIAFSFTTLFFLAYPFLQKLIANKIVLGILYGAFIWATMSFLVLPLTNVPPFPFVWSRALVGMAILMLAIGLPLSFLANRFYADK
jgi:hypothetical protein